MKKLEGNMKQYGGTKPWLCELTRNMEEIWGNMKKYEGKMKKYETMKGT